MKSVARCYCILTLTSTNGFPHTCTGLWWNFLVQEEAWNCLPGLLRCLSYHVSPFSHLHGFLQRSQMLLPDIRLALVCSNPLFYCILPSVLKHLCTIAWNDHHVLLPEHQVNCWRPGSPHDPFHASGIAKLTHLSLEKMAVISQTIFSNAFSWIKIFVFWLKFHWRLFLWVQLTIIQCWFR